MLSISLLGQCLLVVAHGMFPDLREYGSPEAYAHAVANSGDAPGTYVKYDWPKALLNQVLSTDMEVDHIWTTIPSGTDSHGNGVFASSQYWHHDKVSGSTNAGGYMGSQVMRRGNGSERRVFIFSCWDANISGVVHRVGWTTPDTCARFGGEGVGSHCILDYPTLSGRLYNFRVAYSGKNASGAMWTGKVTDTVTGASAIVGTLFYPHVAGNVGFGNLGVYTNEFLEYFEGGDCDTAVHVAVGTIGPFFNQRKSTATQAYPQYGSGKCKRTSVLGCIPGHGCGHPRVFVQGGKGVERNNSDTTKLWSPALVSATVLV